MLERLNIRGKLLATVLVPVLVLAIAAAYIVVTSYNSYRESANARDVIDAIGSAGPTIEALQLERDAAINFVTSLQASADAVEIARQDTDSHYAAFVQAAQGDPEALKLVSTLSATLDVSDGGTPMSSNRAVTITPPATPADWVQFPDARVLYQLRTSYNANADIVANAAEGLPDSSPAKQWLRALASDIETEGAAVLRYMSEPQPYMDDFIENQDKVTIALADLDIKASRVADTDANALVKDNLRSGLELRDDLTALRESVRAGTAGQQTVSNEYTNAITAFQDAMDAAASVIPDATTVAELQAYAALDKLVERMRFESVTYEALIHRRTFVSGESDQVRAIGVRTDLALEEAQQRVQAVPGLGTVADFGASAGNGQASLVSFNVIRLGIQSGRSAELSDAADENWSGEVQQEIDAFAPVRVKAWDEVSSRSSASVQASAIRAILTLAIVVAAIAGSLAIAQIIARRIINPLRRLTTTATAVRQELPRLVERVALPGREVDVTEVQIPVESQDEVGRLAEAFNSVNAATLSIAAEQAALRGSISEMFINVARRDQVLLNRQLASIDEMERTQDDPDTLTKLFALDHLATRMRRNSESLLVLAGIDTGRRLRRPMPLSDVIRTASSEIELYERVVLQLESDPSMLGHSALTAAHLFAELLENATVFSDPGTEVTVATRQDGNSYIVTVEDRGIGMTQEELAEANARVASTAASEILGAQRLGLFVVGRIARRVGARVYLESTEGEGTVATVVMPASLFDLSVDTSDTPDDASVSDDAVHAPSALVNRSDEVRELDEAAAAKPLSGGYTPPVVVEGASLAGREPLLGAATVADTASEPAASPEEADAPSEEIAQLIAEDAALAPTVTEVDTEALTDGSTAAGLPTRRRGKRGPEAPKDTNSIIALPSKASDEQLSALQTAATTGFTPILAADEVSPERAEERSRVFRGFRPMRTSEPAPVEVEPDAESLGQALRRGAAEAPPAYAAGTSEDEESGAGEAGRDEDATAQSSGAVTVAVDDEQEQGTEEEQVEGYDYRQPGTGQSPLISAGFDPMQTFQPTEASEAIGLEVPLLEDDDEPPYAPAVVVEPGPLARQNVVPQVQHPAQPVDPAAAAWQQQAAEAMQQPVQRSPLYPAAGRTAFAPPQVPQFGAQEQPFAGAANEQAFAQPAAFAQRAPQAVPPFPQPAPATSSPSLDDLILDGVQAPPARQGFFNKLFGRGKDDAIAPAAAPSPIVELAQSGGFAQVPVAQPSGFTSPESLAYAATAEQPLFAPAADQQQAWPVAPVAETPVYQEQAPGYGYGAETPASAGYQEAVEAPYGYEQAQPFVQEAIYDGSGQAQGYGHDAYGQPFGQQGYDAQPDAGVFPQGLDSGYGAGVGFGQGPGAGSPAADLGGPQPFGQVWGGQSAFEPAAAPPTPDAGAFLPDASATTFGGDDWSQYQEPHAAPQSGALFDSSTGTFYSPDQLARPLGWEAAGESALLASEATSYSPIVQIDPEPQGEGEVDLTSMAFSELSSLAAERPKVERTRAGLVKRAAVAPVEEEPEAPAAESTRVERDPNAVGRRFAAFYSGTRRARTDAEQLRGRAETR